MVEEQNERDFLTVRESAQHHKVSTQAIRDAARRGEIKTVMERGESAYALLLDRSSVLAWQPARQAGWSRTRGTRRGASKIANSSFIPIAKVVLPKSLPTGRWFQIKKEVWIGLIEPTAFKSDQLPPGVELLFKSNELVLLRYAPSERKRK